jgi:hypothetical protein
MPLAVLSQIKSALANLNPAEVRDEADRPVRVGLVASSPTALGRMETFLAPPLLSQNRRAEALRLLIRNGSGPTDIQIYEDSLIRPAGAFGLDLEDPDACVRRIVRKKPELQLALARRLYPFRNAATQHIVRTIAKENALFSLATAIPDVVPSLGSLPWAIAEFGSDAAILTVNQIRMAFLLAAASDRPVGYREQASEIASIIAGAFGWRAIARELIGKIPFGGGLIPKAGVAWAGTFVVGLSIERLYRLGYGFTRTERRAVYEDAYEHGRQIARMLLSGMQERRVAS